MFRRTRHRRVVVLAPLLTTLVGGSLLASSAEADEPDGSGAGEQPVITVSVSHDDLGLPVPSSSPGPTHLSWGMQKTGEATARDVVITMDLTGIADFATTERDCPGDVCTFSPGDVSDPDNAGGILPLEVKPGAELGTSGELAISGSSSNGTVLDRTVRVTAGRADLVVNEPEDEKGVRPGTTLHDPVTVGNIGSLAADGVSLRLRSTAGLEYAQRYSNCVYGTGDDDVSYHLVNEAVCRFDTKVEPGKQYRLSEPVGLDVTNRALNELFDYRATPANGSAARAGGSEGTGPELTLVPDGAAPAQGEDQAMQVIDVDNTADLKAGGDRATGKPGQLVNLTASLRSRGPATVDVNQDDNQLGVMVDIPKGTKAVGIPEDCSPWSEDGPGQPAPGKPVYICYVHSPFAKGDVEHLTFGLKIKAGATGVSKGEVRATTVYDLGLPFDHNPSNNTARLKVKVKGAGSAAR
ncbi:hypothetical protein LHJ74_32700 [Streptomyces sp. N2-109]|uniref:DUF11 domain-containing protein n=1 Tax=Streptomyces gossypii TaxID=2883101 RepID=A0ABT2K3E2_9ACTN|nr:hypothetical protein [Streptomyces gossypii]MCT2594616.1 hypothetical protein [Streptomyces gossypii]